jgi:hypothetical protein
MRIFCTAQPISALVCKADPANSCQTDCFELYADIGSACSKPSTLVSPYCDLSRACCAWWASLCAFRRSIFDICFVCFEAISFFTRSSKAASFNSRTLVPYGLKFFFNRFGPFARKNRMLIDATMPAQRTPYCPASAIIKMRRRE